MCSFIYWKWHCNSSVSTTLGHFIYRGRTLTRCTYDLLNNFLKFDRFPPRSPRLPTVRQVNLRALCGKKTLPKREALNVIYV